MIRVCLVFPVIFALSIGTLSTRSSYNHGREKERWIETVSAQTVPHANQQENQASTTWRFDQLGSIDGHPTTVLGHPQLIETPYGKAIQFNGVDDALFVDVHPLAGASTFTWEVIFRPDADGQEAQRFFHLQEVDQATGQDTDNRMLFETRVMNGQWCLDSFATTNGQSKTLLDCTLLHPAGEWFSLTAVYDGKVFSNYVDGVLQGSGDVHLVPQSAGRTSIGTRINKTFYFKGAVLMARMTPRALAPNEFLKVPSPVAGK
jgi:hypothetical protein